MKVIIKREEIDRLLLEFSAKLPMFLVVEGEPILPTSGEKCEPYTCGPCHSKAPKEIEIPEIEEMWASLKLKPSTVINKLNEIIRAVNLLRTIKR